MVRRVFRSPINIEYYTYTAHTGCRDKCNIASPSGEKTIIICNYDDGRLFGVVIVSKVYLKLHSANS